MGGSNFISGRFHGRREGEPNSELPEPINWYYYPSVRIGTTKTLNWVSRSTMYWLEKYVNGLIVQFNRLLGDWVATWEAQKGDLMKDAERAKAFHQWSERQSLDIHFYLICWDKVDKFFRRLARSERAKDCVQEVWTELRPVTEKASLARNFFEHLDETISEENFGQSGHTMSSKGDFAFQYIDVSKKGERFERRVVLGRAQVESVLLAYEKVLVCLGADISEGYRSSRGH